VHVKQLENDAARTEAVLQETEIEREMAVRQMAAVLGLQSQAADVTQDLHHELVSLQHAATHCNTLQHTSTHCNTLQHATAHCNTLQRTATHCNTLQHTATHCSTLQHTATHCNTLQHTATHQKDTLPHTTTSHFLLGHHH